MILLTGSIFANLCLSVAAQPVQQVSANTNLIDRNHIWKGFGSAVVTQSDLGLTIRSSTNFEERIFNRGYLVTVLPQSQTPLHMLLSYSTQSTKGNGTFSFEIRDEKGQELWSGHLLNTGGEIRDLVFVLPASITQKKIEFRIYIITNGPGDHLVFLTQAKIANAYG